MSAAEETPRRLRAVDEIERLGGLLSQALTRAPRSGQPSIEIGETAQGRAYIKSIQVYQDDEEGWAQMCNRALSMFAHLRERLPEYVEPAPGTKVVHVQGKKAS